LGALADYKSADDFVARAAAGAKAPPTGHSGHGAMVMQHGQAMGGMPGMSGMSHGDMPGMNHGATPGMSHGDMPGMPHGGAPQGEGHQ
jgi:uncharacterized protein involved in copper resistance